MTATDTTKLSSQDTAYFYKVKGQQIRPMDWSRYAYSQKSKNTPPTANTKNDLELMGEIYGALFLLLALIVLAIPKVKGYFASSFNLRSPKPTRSIMNTVDELFEPHKSNFSMMVVKVEIQKILSGPDFKYTMLENAMAGIGIGPSKDAMNLLRAMDGLAYTSMDPHTMKFLEDYIRGALSAQALYDFSNGSVPAITKESIISKYKLESWITSTFKGDRKTEALAHGMRQFFENRTLDVNYLEKLIITAGIKDFDIQKDEIIVTMHSIPWEKMTDEMVKHIVAEIKHIFSNHNKSLQPV